LDINIVEEPDALEFQITDYYSNLFNPVQVLQKRTTMQNIIAERRKGGIGLMLVQTIMDEIEVSHEGCQSIWRLRKNLRNVPQDEVQN
jgi:serine/threonine-protein kinase RsbW